MAAAFTNGLLAGGNVDRLLVATPAWEQVGLTGWADFSRAADLGHGQIFYPAIALGSTALAVLAVASLMRKPTGRRDILVSVGLSAGFMIIALPFSLKAVPFMQSLRSIHDGELAALKQAFAGAHFWGGFQGYFHIAAFCSELWAVAALARFGDRAAPDEIASSATVRK
jgi:hypothetical protein